MTARLLNRGVEGIVAFVLILGEVSCTGDASGHRPPLQSQINNNSVASAHTQIVELRAVADSFQAPGTVRAKTQTVVASKVIGEIISLNVREADHVRKGDLLAEIESRDAASRLRQAEAGQREARQALEEADGAIRAAEWRCAGPKRTAMQRRPRANVSTSFANAGL
jgi:macrolide-specific efflux system membrane fusion protein